MNSDRNNDFKGGERKENATAVRLDLLRPSFCPTPALALGDRKLSSLPMKYFRKFFVLIYWWQVWLLRAASLPSFISFPFLPFPFPPFFSFPFLLFGVVVPRGPSLFPFSCIDHVSH